MVSPIITLGPDDLKGYDGWQTWRCKSGRPPPLIDTECLAPAHHFNDQGSKPTSPGRPMTPTEHVVDPSARMRSLHYDSDTESGMLVPLSRTSVFLTVNADFRDDKPRLCLWPSWTRWNLQQCDDCWGSWIHTTNSYSGRDYWTSLAVPKANDTST